MERTPEDREGGGRPPVEAHTELEAAGTARNVTFDYGYLSPLPPEGESWDAWVIECGIAAALREGRSIDDRTARYIAAELHEGQASALYELASSGTIDEPDVHDELGRRTRQLPEEVRRWARWLSGYCALRLDVGPVADWNERAAAQDRTDMEALRRSQAIAELECLFGEQPEAELGSVDELGWFGIVRHQGRPGGLILREDEQGFRHVWESDSQQELEARWAEVEHQYEEFYREAASQAAGEERGAGDEPHIPELPRHRRPHIGGQHE